MASYIVHLIGGQSVKAFADDSEVDSIYDLFHDNADMVHFENGSFKVEFIAGLEYVQEKKRVDPTKSARI